MTMTLELYAAGAVVTALVFAFFLGRSTWYPVGTGEWILAGYGAFVAGILWPFSLVIAAFALVVKLGANHRKESR